MKHPENEETLGELYDEMEAELQSKINGLNHQIELLSNKRNTIIEVNRTAKTALEVFDDLLHKPTMERNDLELMIDRITVYEDHLEVHLQSDIDALLQSTREENIVNFNSGIENSEKCRIVQRSRNQKDKVFDVNVISGGDPLEIYTDRDGEVIFKKYSPMGELGAVSRRTGRGARRARRGMSCAHLRPGRGHRRGGRREKGSARSGASRPHLEQLMERSECPLRAHRGRGAGACPSASHDAYCAVAAVAPILTDGDVTGCVAVRQRGRRPPPRMRPPLQLVSSRRRSFCPSGLPYNIRKVFHEIPPAASRPRLPAPPDGADPAAAAYTERCCGRNAPHD